MSRGPRALTLALALAAGCEAARADPPRAERAEPRPAAWRALAPGLRWRESRERFADESGAPRETAWVVARVDLSRRSLEVVRSANDRVDGVAGRPLLSVNGGFFEPDLSPSGALRSGGVALGVAGPRGGSGVLVIEGGRGRLLEREALDGGAPWGPAALVLQCGPRLVERDGSVGIHRDDGRRFARTAACLRDGGRTLDLIAAWQLDAPLRGPGLRDLAVRLARGDETSARGCEAALNLDGGPSTGIAARSRAGPWRYQHDALGPTPWLLIARR